MNYLSTPPSLTGELRHVGTRLLGVISAIIILLPGLTSHAQSSEPAGRWSVQKASDWYRKQPWLVGCNFTPSTAINQLEMWQADTFDIATIDRELAWAESIGFNSIRVFLHDLLWSQDSAGFLRRIDQFLKIAKKHHISVNFVLFDSCWDPHPKLGPQHEPKPGLHNSGWVQSPGCDYLGQPQRLEELKPYVLGIIGHFRNDRRVIYWDLFNEPDNMNESSYPQQEPAGKQEAACQLLEKAFAWARAARPSQPLTSGVWKGNWSDPTKLSPMERIQLENSDIITFHNYGPMAEARQCVENLGRYQRPILCTEYMARPVASTFDPNLSFFKSRKVAAYNWGFVAGKTQTIFPWDSWKKTYTSEPPLWFHDIFRADGTPYKTEEVAFIRSVTLANGAPKPKAAPARELVPAR